MTKPKQPDKKPECPLALGVRPIVVVIAEEEPQMWKQMPSGNVIPYWVDDEARKQKPAPLLRARRAGRKPSSERGSSGRQNLVFFG